VHISVVKDIFVIRRRLKFATVRHSAGERFLEASAIDARLFNRAPDRGVMPRCLTHCDGNAQ